MFTELDETWGNGEKDEGAISAFASGSSDLHLPRIPRCIFCLGRVYNAVKHPVLLFCNVSAAIGEQHIDDASKRYD